MSLQTTFQPCYLAWVLLRLLSLEAKVFMYLFGILFPKNCIKIIINLTNLKFLFKIVDCKENFQFYLQKDLIRGVLMTGPSLKKHLTPSASSLGAKA